MPRQLGKVGFKLESRRRSKTLVVLDLPLGRVRHLGVPLVEFGQGIKIARFGSVSFWRHFYNWRDKLLNERCPEHAGPEVVNEIDDETLYERDEQFCINLNFLIT